MARTSVHVCSECGLQSAKWHGQCPGCEAWNTLVEEAVEPPRTGSGKRARTQRARVRRARRACRERVRARSGRSEPQRWQGCPQASASSTAFSEGAVPGSLVLLGGSPGIGKSTLTNMVLGHLEQAGHRTLYVSGEESAEQVRLRASASPRRGAMHVPVLAETDLDEVLAALEPPSEPAACAIDSVQTLGAGRALRRARIGRPGPRGGREDHGARQGTRDRGDPGRARDQGRRARRARACSNTSSTACCSSRASASAPTASCAR